MAKDMFYAAINNIEKKTINTQSPNVIFIGSNDSKAELLYKNIPFKVVEKNYRYVLDREDEIKQNNDFFGIFEKSLLVQKTLIESSESKIVFVIDSGCIFNARASEFTSWLKSIDKSFGSQNLFNSSCLVIESVSKDSDPILELQSLIKDSLGRISDINLKLLGNWLDNEKIKLIQNFSKKDLGEYDSTYFQKELGDILQKCSSVSYLDSKPFLPSETIDSQRAFYKEISNEILNSSKDFVDSLREILMESLKKDADTYDFNQFEKNYHNMLTKLDVPEHLIYKSMIKFQTLNIGSLSLKKIAEYVKQLEETEGKITNLMIGVLDLHDPEMHRLDFGNNINNLKNALKNNWDDSITKASEALRTYSDLYTLFELNEKCKIDSKKIGLEFYWKKRDIITEKDIAKLLEPHKELCLSLKKLNDFCHSDNHLKESVIKNIEAYSNFTPLYKIIYQSIIESSINQNKDTKDSFVNSYVQYVKNLYSQLYNEYNEVMTNLEKEYDQCISYREKVVVGAGGAGGVILGIGATSAVTIISGGTLAPFVFFGGFLGVGTGGGAYWYKKKLSENSDYTGGFDSVGQYYKQLPKDLRESWADINVFPKLSEYLKKTYPANEIYSQYEAQYNEEYTGHLMLAIEEDKGLKKNLESKKEGLLENDYKKIQLQNASNSFNISKAYQIDNNDQDMSLAGNQEFKNTTAGVTSNFLDEPD